MRKLRTSVLALTTVTSLALGGTAVATAEEAPSTNSSNVTQGSSKEGDNKGSSSKLNQGSSKEGDNKGSSSKLNQGSSKDKQDNDQDKNNGGSADPTKGWVPGHSFGSTLQTDYVPVWAKIWIAVLTVVGLVTAGLFAAPGITAMKMHNIIPSFH